MRKVSENMVAIYRKHYPAGKRLRLEMMDDPQAPPLGTVGTVIGVDDACQIMMKWDNGSSLSLIPGVDGFTEVQA